MSHVYRQYSRDGMFIADYKSSRLAYEATGVSLGSIARAAHGERKTGGGYLWRVVPENTPEDPISVDLTSRIGYHDKRPLIQMTLDGEPVAEFISIAHASRSLGISRRSLSCALTGAGTVKGSPSSVRLSVHEQERGFCYGKKTQYYRRTVWRPYCCDQFQPCRCIQDCKGERLP